MLSPQPGSSRSTSASWTVGDPVFEDRLRRLLEEDVDDPNDSDEEDSVVDDSDADPDYVMRESGEEESSSSDDEEMLDDDMGETDVVVNAVAPDIPMPQFFLERMRKTEQDPPNAWNSIHPPRNVRTHVRTTMSLNRYKVLVASLRFDDAQTREQRKQTDKAAPISEIFDKIIKNSQAVYRPSAYVTINEMLVPFRGRCAFRMYMP